MGKTQQQMMDKADTHAAAVALTYHRAAVAVDPHNSVAHRELGKTLYGQGLVEQAAWSLAQSVDLQPTRDNYRLLMQASRKLGDIDTVRRCQTAIDDPRLAAPLPIHHLDAKAFAATYKPSDNEMPQSKSRNQTVSARKPSDSSTKQVSQSTSTLSQFKSWLPKFRRE